MLVGVVLVVEDEPLILLDVETALQEAGFEVVAATSAEEAIAAFDAEPEKVKGLVTDIRLGEEKTGWEVAKHLRQANPTLPVVYMSGDSAIDWGFEGVPESVMVTKPFFLPQIITALSTLLNAQPVNQDPLGVATKHGDAPD
ncbi:response regulator [Mesorhizobium sp. WSM1497]|uniref:response regulator n=1 Tax=Mesorhizobium sp. WSM1497 TaxID=278153 RepID=UPI0007EE01C1|nr:response regulator [Mesorhizobium sp. WSM1497]ARP64353.1 response regulator [Mesorhizobium sp. WSM1497]